jgi:hypothetical protein
MVMNNRHRLALAVIALAAASCDPGTSDLEPPTESGDGTELREEALRLTRRCAGPRGLECPSGQYCKERAVGRCPSKSEYGVCAAKPQACTQIFAPVCGCDGRTYSNSCMAAAAGASVSHEGACRPQGPFCGGIAGIPCPENLTCVDDPSDDCDPKNGGADCGGICVPEAPNPCATVLCQTGTQCVVKDGQPVCVPNGGPTCGSNVCPAGQVCCNASCGICTPPDGACIQIVCDAAK